MSRMPLFRKVERLALFEAAENVHHHAGRAKAALQGVALLESLLDRMQDAVLGSDGLDGADVAAVRLDREREA